MGMEQVIWHNSWSTCGDDDYNDDDVGNNQADNNTNNCAVHILWTLYGNV